MKCRFVGRVSTLHGEGYSHILNQYGQQVDLPKEAAELHVIQGAGLLPEPVFVAAGVTDDELEKYKVVGLHDIEPAEEKDKKAHAVFLAKRDQTWAKVIEWRNQILKSKAHSADRPAPVANAEPGNTPAGAVMQPLDAPKRDA